MSKMLENLWDSDPMEDFVERNEEKKRILDQLIINEEKLRANLDEEQAEMLKICEDCLNDISAIDEKEAFMKGIRFATRFMVEALYKN